MAKSNIVYMIFVSIFLMCIFIFYDYSIKNRYIKELLLYKKGEDKTPILPSPFDYKDEIYMSMIEDLYMSYTEKLNNLEEKFDDNNDFVTAWVHEIKTPIATSKLLLESGEINLKSFKEEIDKIDDYVEKVLYYSRSDDFSKDYIISEVDVGKLVKESIKIHSSIFIKKHIKLKLEIGSRFSVDTDKKWLLFIVNQVISNALKYTSLGGTILIRASQSDNEKILLIEDTGVGIKKEDLSRIFAKSFTGYNGRKENSKATGLGLYLSYKLARKLGHNITVESEYNKGTKFYIHFPKWCDYYELTKM
ncbi:sensor histidine kinase [Clostridium guangxiense]|uniref:sensor histidine kinase n=1 Tax=Clostridium guangxiense TaxID=1662055 RepID=UPI001E2B6864|nr:HAMP domain-containing sensor histidine kinase [Clostridium guangxiense]MCD2348757.1 HAMP domain-containing histidine kinase [Clostridium guangxiense]